MRRELIKLCASLTEQGEPFVLATVVARTPPISAQVGDVAVVTRDGGFHGWVGGSCTRPTVIAEARKALDDHRPRLVALDPNPDGRRRPGLTVFPMTCGSGGSVEIHIQPVLPPPRLVVFGASPTARALVRLAKAVGYTVVVVDPAAEPADFPDADAVETDPGAVARHRAGPAVPLYAVVATQGQWDETALVAATELLPDYLGVMASTKRFGEMRAFVAEKAGDQAVERIKNPAGLDLGAVLPEEIAVSIIAEIVQKRRSAKSVEHGAVVGMPAAAEARDPVCGMKVTIAGAAHHAEHGGKTFYFCCGGCRVRFLASPERYLVPNHGAAG